MLICCSMELGNHIFDAYNKAQLHRTENIFNVIFTVFKYVPISTVISLYCLHLIATPSTVE